MKEYSIKSQIELFEKHAAEKDIKLCTGFLDNTESLPHIYFETKAESDFINFLDIIKEQCFSLAIIHKEILEKWQIDQAIEILESEDDEDTLKKIKQLPYIAGETGFFSITGISSNSKIIFKTEFETDLNAIINEVSEHNEDDDLDEIDEEITSPQSLLPRFFENNSFDSEDETENAELLNEGLLRAIRQNNISKVDELISKGASVFKQNELVYQIIVDRIQSNDFYDLSLDLIKKLVNAGFDINFETQEKISLLKNAIKFNQGPEVIQELITLGADVNLKSKISKKVPLDYVEWRFNISDFDKDFIGTSEEKKEISNLLLASGAKDEGPRELRTSHSTLDPDFGEIQAAAEKFSNDEFFLKEYFSKKFNSSKLLRSFILSNIDNHLTPYCDLIFELAESLIPELTKEEILTFAKKVALDSKFQLLKRKPQQRSFVEDLLPNIIRKNPYVVEQILERAIIIVQTEIVPAQEKEFYEKIRKMKDEGKTRKEIARELNLPYSEISKYI